MIKVRSTYNVYPTTADEYKLSIYIWDGALSPRPTEPEYEITNYSQEGASGTDEVGISNILNDYIDIEPITLGPTGFYDSPNQKWVNVDYNDVQVLLADSFNLGYGYAMDGINAETPTDKILITGRDFNVNRNGYFNVPIQNDLSMVTVISYPNNEINFSETLTSNGENTQIVQNVLVNLNETTVDEYVEITFNSEVVTLYVKDEYKYTPLDVHFINKEGQQQIVTFFKERKETIDIDKETYERKGINITNGDHQFKDYNLNSKSSFTMNSGFIDEENNEVFKQLLLSEYVWCYDNGYVPLNISTSSLEYKNRLNDRLIKYNIEFEYSFNDITNI